MGVHGNGDSHGIEIRLHRETSCLDVKESPPQVRKKKKKILQKRLHSTTTGSRQDWSSSGLSIPLM